MYIFPLWSGVRLKKCGFPQTRDSNSPAEVWFKVLKNDISVPQRSRPGKFVIGIKQLIDARFKENLYPKCRQPKAKRKKNTDQQKLILEEEKWQKKKTKLRKYQPPTKSTKQKGKVLPSVMAWGGTSVGVFLSNTCTIDNGLTILHIAFKENVIFNEAIQNDKDNILSRELLTIFKLMDDTHFSDAKKTWINFIKSNTSDDDPKKKTVANLFGDEFDFFISHLEKQWGSDVVSTCSNATCPLQHQLRKRDSGFGTNVTEGKFKTIQDLVDTYMLSYTNCNTNIDKDAPSKGRCTGKRTIVRAITNYSPIAVVRVYEHALMERIKLDDVLKTPNLQLQKKKYYLAGVTMFKNTHYCAVVLIGSEFWWYDGLVGKLQGLPRDIDSWFPSHAIYCVT